MKPVGIVFYQCTPNEARNLPHGFQFLEYDTLYNSMRMMRAGENNVRNEKRYVYLCYKQPPVISEGEKVNGGATS